MGSPVYGQQYNVIPNNQNPLPPAYSLESLLTKDHGKHGAKAEAVKEFQDYVRGKAKGLWDLMTERKSDASISCVKPITWPPPIPVQVSSCKIIKKFSSYIFFLSMRC